MGEGAELEWSGVDAMLDVGCWDLKKIRKKERKKGGRIREKLGRGIFFLGRW